MSKEDISGYSEEDQIRIHAITEESARRGCDPGFSDTMYRSCNLDMIRVRGDRTIGVSECLQDMLLKNLEIRASYFPPQVRGGPTPRAKDRPIGDPGDEPAKPKHTFDAIKARNILGGINKRKPM
jgi:hypothetical protein